MQTLTVLTVEDSKPLSNLIAMLLKAAGFAVVQASDGEEALQILQQLQPDVILSDIELPSLSGLQLARELKADPRWRWIPLIAVTSHDDRGELMAAGFDGHLRKPLDVERFCQLVETFISAARSIRSVLREVQAAAPVQTAR
ncbi:MAG: response regulator [Candidatus Xenobia bacterium]